jgi:hypothetical protein
MYERNVQQEKEQWYCAERQCRMKQARPAPVNSPEKNQSGAERHQKKQERRRIFICIQE